MTAFKSNFVDSLDNNETVRNFYLKFDNSKQTEVKFFQVNEVEKAVFMLFSSVALDCDELSNCHLKYAHPAIFKPTALKLLFNSMIEFDVVSHNFGVSVITPVVKNILSSLHDVNSYRPVAIISVISKAFESLINLHFGQLFAYNENQFGFSVGGGCNEAMFAFNNIVKYFKDRHSIFFLSGLDVTKAFDRVNHFNVMKCLLERGFPC